MPKFKTPVIGENGVFDGVSTNRVYSPTNQQPIINPDPTDHGLKAWAFDPAPLPLNSTVLTAGLLNLVKMYVAPSTSVGSAYLQVVTGGATLANVGVALYSAAGALLTSSVNANGATATAFQSTGTKTITFTTPQTISGGFYLGFWTTGTTQPALLRGTQSLAMNINLAAPNFRFGKANTALTNAAPATLGTMTASADAFFAAAA